MAEKVTVRAGERGAYKRELDATGWLSEEVEAAGRFRQGRAPSLRGMLTGTAVIGLFKRGSKTLPKTFVLAVTNDRVVAFKSRGYTENDRDDVTTIMRE